MSMEQKREYFEFKVVDASKATDLRGSFISSFVDKTRERYNEHIETLHTYPDGDFYRGYLWDFLLDNKEYEYECNTEAACEYLRKQGSVYVMWDLHSNHGVFDRSAFATEYPRDTIIEASAERIAQMIPTEWEDWDGSRN